MKGAVATPTLFCQFHWIESCILFCPIVWDSCPYSTTIQIPGTWLPPLPRYQVLGPPPLSRYQVLGSYNYPGTRYLAFTIIYLGIACIYHLSPNSQYDHPTNSFHWWWTSCLWAPLLHLVPQHSQSAIPNEQCMNLCTGRVQRCLRCTKGRRKYCITHDGCICGNCGMFSFLLYCWYWWQCHTRFTLHSQHSQHCTLRVPN